MKKILYLVAFPAVLLSLFGCSGDKQAETSNETKKEVTTAPDTFKFQVEQFADLRVLRYRVPGFDELKPKRKELLYYLYEAALCGRDIIWDQNCMVNLAVRKTIENIISTYSGDKTTEDYGKFIVYAKRVWFSNGIHHHYSMDKIMPEFSKEYLTELIDKSDPKGFPLEEGQNTTWFKERMQTVILDPGYLSKRVVLDSKKDMIATSATGFYDKKVTQKEAQSFYASKVDGKSKTPVMYGLNSKLVKEDGKIVEKVWKIGGMYSAAIEKIVFWLEKAAGVTENAKQKDALVKLIKYYKSGDLKDFDEYCIAWVKDIDSEIDVVNGFIEVYGDPIGYKGSFESVVSVRDPEASKRIKAIGAEAQWFEDHSPIAAEHKKKNVKGISAKVINVVIESGDAAPATPIGINLPNSNWIREDHGSKSVNLGNIVEAYDRSAGPGVVGEFYLGEETQKRVSQCGPLSDKLHTDMHEVIGHASGIINEGIADPATTLQNYANCLEEARADLVALYYMIDKKLVDMGVMPSIDYGKAQYDKYITNGLMVQLARVKLGNNLEEAHMRNRQLIAAWVYEKGKADSVIVRKTENGKTYFVVNDYEKLRVLFGQLLKEIQRVKSEGDFEGGKALVEDYGVKIDKVLHKEVLERYASLKLAPYQGFIQPKLVPVMKNGKIVDVKIEYPWNFVDQMLYYGKEYSFLPVNN
ncbi:MAG: dihydrofolate reductase [Flavobacteriales bacterium]